MKIKNLLPQYAKLNGKLLQRLIRDKKMRVVFAKQKTPRTDFSFCIEECQPIRNSSYYQNKIDNISLGASMLEDIIIEQGETLSFWDIIGNPTAKRGFKIGRNLIGGKLTADFGGGLCQLSGIMYFTSLKAGLQIEERYNHTVDIYQESERFTPLGSDATIVYGYKDLRVKNPYPFPVKFKFEMDDSSIICRLFSLENINSLDINFSYEYRENNIFVTTVQDNTILNVSTYIKK